MCKLIALYSPVPQSGKSTIADTLLNLGWVKVSFADTLKRMAEILLRDFVSDEIDIYDRLYGELKQAPIPLLGVDARKILQTLGTDWGRNIIHEQIWVLGWKNRVLAAHRAGKNVVTDDMRFPNEMAAVRELNGKCWWINRKSTANTYGHASEGALNGAFNIFDAHIDNSGSKDTLKAKVELHLMYPDTDIITRAT